MFSIPWGKGKKDTSECEKLELIGKLESGVFVTYVCEEYRYLDLMDISNIGHPFTPFSPLN